MPVMEHLLPGEPADLTDAERGRWAAAVDLGRRAAAGDDEARTALATGGGAVLDDEGVGLYLDQPAFGAVAGVNASYLRRLRADGRLLEADVVTGRVWGWSIGRAIMWAIEYGYLTPDLEHITSRRGRAEAVAALTLEGRPHWRFTTVGYLTQVEVADFLGITDDSVHQARLRGTGPREAIRIKTIPGFDLDMIRAFNRRRPPHMRALSQEPGETTA